MKFRYNLFVLVLLALFILVACEDTTCPDVGLTSPSNLSLEQLDWSSIQLTWQDNTSKEDYYQIDRKIGENEWETGYQTLAENSTSFTDSNLVDIGNYKYRIFAYNSKESSGFTEATCWFSYNDVQIIYPADEETVLLYPGEIIEYQVHLLDAMNELVERDYEVWFKLLSAPEGADINGILVDDLDSLSVSSFAGVASINITAGSEEGEILFQAYTKNSNDEKITADLTAYVDHQYPEVAEIVFLNADQISLGGNDSVDIGVDLLDDDGNIVQEEYDVFVEFMGRPEGTNLNEEVYELGEYLTIPTENGRAIFTLNSGVVSGNVGLRIYTYNSIEEISEEVTNILVQAGAPAYCELYSGGIDEGEDVGNGIWGIHLDALITDMYGNPVQNGTTVFFSLPDNPDGVTFETPNVFVGNINDPIPGVAYNFLTYDGTYTNDVVTVNIMVGSIDQEFEVLLPLQFGQLNVSMVPAHFAWTEDNDPEYVDIECRILLNDQQNNPINGQYLVFSTTMGTALEPSPPDTGDPWSGLTGVGTLPPFEGVSGILLKHIRVYKTELPPPNPDPIPVEMDVIIQVAGTDVSVEFSIILGRYFD